MSIYPLVGKALYFVAYPLMRILGTRLTGTRVRIHVINGAGDTLLVKTWFGKQLWSLPGGGINKGELPEHAAIRELEEETAIIARAEDLEFLGEMKRTEGLPFHLLVYRLHVKSAQLNQLPKGRQYEIIDRMWCAPDSIPDHTSAVVRWALDRLD